MQTQDFIRIGKRWVPLALLLACTAAVTSYALTKVLVHSRYTSTVTMQVQLGLASQGASNTIDPSYNQSYAQTAAQVASQNPYIAQAVGRVRATTHLNPSAGELVSVKRSVDCQASPSTALFSCAVTSRDPRFAAEVANALAFVFQRGEQQWEQTRYQDVLGRIVGQERAARQVHDSNRLANLTQLETTTRLAAAQRESIVRVISPAQPASGPSSPHPTLNAAVAFLAVLLLALGTGVVLDRLDETIRGEEELNTLSRLPLLGTVPAITGLKDKRLSPDSLVVVSDPRSSSAEAFRVVRTGIAFSRVDNPPHRILVTSTAQGEGKSTFAANIACAYAESGKSTILVDLDLRRPSLSALAPSATSGFTNLLLDDSPDPEKYLVPGPVPRLQILPSGPIPPSPAELITSQRMSDAIRRLQSLADVIIVDSPPILAAADAAITASLCDGVVLLVRPDRVTRGSFLRAVETVRGVGTPVIGLVINGITRSDTRYGSYEYHYDSYKPVKGSSNSGISSSPDKTLAG